MLRERVADAASRTEPHRHHEDRAWLLVLGAWVIATTATLGALFFSEILQLPPCLLCWYQRIFMFPLALLLPMGLFPFDRRVVSYALPLVLPGTAIAVYHELLVVGVIPQTASPCTRGIPCAETLIEWFGFVTIPLLAAVAFTSILVLLVLAYREASK